MSQMNLQRALVPLNTFIVSAYKLLGFAVLTTILVGLTSYLGVQVYYFVSRGWVAPTILSPTDPRVLQLNEQLTEQSSQRDRVLATRHELAARLQDAERVLAAEEDFQKHFHRAVQADLVDRQEDLQKFQRVARDLSAAKGDIRSANQAFSGASRERAAAEYRAHLIDRDTYLGESHMLAQVAHGDLSLAQDEINLQTRASALRREIESLQALRKDEGAAAVPPLSHDVLRIQQEYVRSVLSANKARDDRDALRKSIEATDRSLARYDRIIKALEDAPFLRAVERNLAIAFVPYENLRHVAPGTPLYGCEFGLLWCHRVGQATAVLPGETTMPHPVHNQLLRGQMVQMDLSDGRWAEQKVLFLGRAPLFL